MRLLIFYCLPALLLIFSCNASGTQNKAGHEGRGLQELVAPVPADTSYHSFLADTSLRFKDTPALLAYLNDVVSRWENYKKSVTAGQTADKELLFRFQQFWFKNQDLLTYLVFQYLRDAPKVQGNFFLLKYNDDFSRIVSPKERLAIFALFPESLRNSRQGKELFTRLNRQTTPTFPAAGSIKSAFQAGHFTAETMDGRTVALKDLLSPGHEQYLIIFGASWCGPCRYENAWLKRKLNNQMSGRLKIIHISVDTNRDQWLKAAREDQCPWEQVRVNGQESSIGKFFRVDAVPLNLLLDKDGVPVAREINIENIWKIIDPNH